jgi:hypothetical protein
MKKKTKTALIIILLIVAVGSTSALVHQLTGGDLVAETTSTWNTVSDWFGTAKDTVVNWFSAGQ